MCPVPADTACWQILDAADEWDSPAVEFIIEKLLPRRALVWLGGQPKRGKSLWPSTSR